MNILAFVTAQVLSATYQQPLQCQATAIALNNPSTSATVTCPNLPPPSGSCQQGATGDVPGYTAQCAGTYKLHAGGGDITKGPSQYTYSFVFGDSWPGDTFGATRIITIDNDQFLSIPFKPSPGHTIQFANNGTYTKPGVLGMTISTSPGLFNNLQVGNGVLCANDRGNLVVSSNGSTTANCRIGSTQTVWLNIIPAKYGTGGWGVPDSNACQTASCPIGITLYKTN